MSDESTPPPLRLKPRARPEDESPAVETALLASDATNVDSGFPKLRLKPKLNAEESSNSASAETPSAPAAKPTVSLDRVATPANGVSVPAVIPSPVAVTDTAASVPPAAPASETPSFKFKVKSPDAVVAVVSSVPAPAEASPPVSEAPAPAPKFPPPPPPRAPAAAKPELPSFPPPRPVPHLKASDIEEHPQPVAPVVSASPSPLKKYLGLAAGVVLVAAGGFTYRTLRTPSAPPPVVAAEKKAPAPVTVAPTPTPAPAPVAPVVAASEPAKKDLPPPAAAPVSVTPPAPAPKPTGPTPSDTLNQLAGAPLRAINKAKAAVAAHTDSTSDIPAISSPVPARKVAATTTKAVISTGVVATVAVANASDTASDEFRAWAGRARISGVFQGSPPRALINGRTVSAGEIVDDALSITFDSFDAATKMIVFRDSTGATVARKF